MAEGSPSSLTQSLSSDTSSICANVISTANTNHYYEQRDIGNDSAQQSTLTISAPNPEEEEEPPSRSPKKPKWSSTAEVDKNEEDSCVVDAAATEASGGNREPFRGSDELLRSDSGIESKKHDSDEIRQLEGENFSVFEQVLASCKNYSEKQSVGAAGASNGGGRSKFVYSRKELEALRFVKVKAQKKLWQEIRNALEKTVRKEYDELKQQKHSNRRQGSEAKNYNGQLIVGESSSEDMSYVAEMKGSVDWTCDDDINGQDSNDVDGDWDEREESDDELDSIQRPAFWVEGEPDFESGPPEDGLEYLRRVRWEAAHIPKVKVAKVDNRRLNKKQSIYMPKIPDIEKCPPHLVPSKQWEDEFIADFSELRLALSRLEETCDTAPTDPNPIIFGPKEHKTHSSQTRASLELPAGDPTLSNLMEMEPATRMALLKKRISLFENASSLSKNECAWLFALCAAVDTPLDADTCASLRCLLRRCAKLRAAKSELDDEAVMLNVLATISGKFFKQLEN